MLMIGGASVPTGLIILGASLGTLNLRHGLPPWYIPSTFSNSRGSIVLMALLKLAVLPIIGVLWTQLLTFHTPLVKENQTMLRFVMILLSGGISVVTKLTIIVPTATTQVVLTQVFAPQGRGTEELNALSAYNLISLSLIVDF
jgi:predicted permease